MLCHVSAAQSKLIPCVSVSGIYYGYEIWGPVQDLVVAELGLHLDTPHSGTRGARNSPRA